MCLCVFVGVCGCLYVFVRICVVLGPARLPKPSIVEPMLCVLGVGSVVAGLLGLLLGWFVMVLVVVPAVCVRLLALLLQGFLGYCWAGC
jgi:hypothetical protein